MQLDVCSGGQQGITQINFQKRGFQRRQPWAAAVCSTAILTSSPLSRGWGGSCMKLTMKGNKIDLRVGDEEYLTGAHVFAIMRMVR